jgi:hypothetical protein
MWPELVQEARERQTCPPIVSREQSAAPIRYFINIGTLTAPARTFAAQVPERLVLFFITLLTLFFVFRDGLVIMSVLLTIWREWIYPEGSDLQQ